MGKRNRNRRQTQGGFAGIPRIVLDHPDFINLSGGAVKVLTELSRQYKGKNNGDLCITHSIAKERKLGAKDSVKNYLKELAAANLIIKTRDGRFTNPGGTPNLYALLWAAIDDCEGKLDVSSTPTPMRKFSLENIKKPCPEIGLSSAQNLGRETHRNARGQFTRPKIWADGG